MDYITDINKIDASRVRLLARAAIEAYNAFDSCRSTRCYHSRITPPDGFEFVDYWSGVDSVFGHDKSVEVYGLVFRSKAPPWRYIFSFRGTDCMLDMLDDLGVESTPFIPVVTSTKLPHEVIVEAGFSTVYRTGAGSTKSMQRQVFALFDKYQTSERPIGELYITGHSLGAALSQLFTLDMALCRPSIPIFNVNFASPRVGNDAFVRFYHRTVTEKAGGHTLRVQNIYDMVPHVPPTELGYTHLPLAYVIAFYRDGWYGKLDVADCHSSLNYAAVVDCGSANPEGICVSRRMVVPGQDYTLRSEHPDLVENPGLHKLIEYSGNG